MIIQQTETILSLLRRVCLLWGCAGTRNFGSSSGTRTRTRSFSDSGLGLEIRVLVSKRKCRTRESGSYGWTRTRFRGFVILKSSPKRVRVRNEYKSEPSPKRVRVRNGSKPCPKRARKQLGVTLQQILSIQFNSTTLFCDLLSLLFLDYFS